MSLQDQPIEQREELDTSKLLPFTAVLESFIKYHNPTISLCFPISPISSRMMNVNIFSDVHPLVQM